MLIQVADMNHSYMTEYTLRLNRKRILFYEFRMAWNRPFQADYQLKGVFPLTNSLTVETLFYGIIYKKELGVIPR